MNVSAQIQVDLSNSRLSEQTGVCMFVLVKWTMHNVKMHNLYIWIVCHWIWDIIV